MFEDIMEDEKEFKECESTDCENCEVEEECESQNDECEDCPVEDIEECDSCVPLKPVNHITAQIWGSQVAKLTLYLLKNNLFDCNHGSSVDQAIRLLKQYTNRCE